MIQRVLVQNFLPFRTRVEFPLAKQGLVLIRGDNRVSAALNDNGSGKTSILHAIAWCLYGEDLNGRKADAVANRFTTDTCLVQLDMEDEQGSWRVIRTRRPGKLWVEGDGDLPPDDSDMSVVQEYIESRMGFGLRTFRNAVVFGQGSFDRFAHADQAEQIKMLDEIQGVDLSEPRQASKDWKSTVVARMGEIEGGLNTDSTVLEQLKNQIKTLISVRDAFEATKRERTRLYESKLSLAEKTYRATHQEVIALDAETNKLIRARKEEMKLMECEAALSLTRQAEDEAGALQDEAGTNLRRLDEQIERVLSHAECPECLGAIDENATERLGKKRTPIRLEAQSKARAYKKTLEASRLALEAVEAQQAVLRAIVGGTEDLSRMIMRLEERCSPVNVKRLKARLLAETQAADEIRGQITAVKGETWDGQASLDKANAAVDSLTERIASERARLERAGLGVDLADYCVEAFSDRGIRSMLVDGVADFVNKQMVEHLDALTAGEATNAMSAQTATKKGTVKERISFTPVWSWGGEGAGTGSGGQDRRVDLATFASFQDLAETQSARPFPFKAYDEPFDALDSRGKEMACQWLRAQATAYGTVLLITHSEELAGLANPDQTWTIVHDEDGARLLLS